MNNRLACGISAVASLDLYLDLLLDGDFASLIDLSLFTFFCSSGSPLLLPFWFWRTYNSVVVIKDCSDIWVLSESHASIASSSMELIVWDCKEFWKLGVFGFWNFCVWLQQLAFCFQLHMKILRSKVASRL